MSQEVGEWKLWVNKKRFKLGSRVCSEVLYMLPELYEPFELVQIRVLPFSLTDNGQTVRFKLESELAAMNSVGESFLFPVGICRREQDL